MLEYKSGKKNNDGVFSNFWTPPTQRDLSSGGGVIPSGGYTSEEAITNLMDELVSNNTGYVTKEILGADESGLYNVYRYIFEPNNYEKTIILIGGTHGNEYTGFYGLYAFLREVCSTNGTYPQLEYLRYNVRMIVLPILNPWGFTNGRRQNSNGVDLNRNGSIYWDRYNSGNELATGEATSGTLTSLTVAGTPWTTNEFADKNLILLTGDGAGQNVYITSNTNNTLTFTGGQTISTAPSSGTTFAIRDKYYKGISAFSEKETQYFQDTVDYYNNATVCLDFHTITTTKSEYIMYVPRYGNSIHGKIKQLINERYQSGERLVYGTSAVPTLTNYACITYGMFGGNPEFNNSRWSSTTRDSVGMEQVVWWFGNLIILHAMQSTKASDANLEFPSMKKFIYQGGDCRHFYCNEYTLDIRDVQYSPDGLNAYFVEATNDKIHQLKLSKAYDLNYATYYGSYTFAEDNFPQGFCWKTDGSSLVMIGSANDKIFQYSASENFDVTTLSYSTNSYDISSATTTPSCITTNANQTKFYVGDYNTSQVVQVTMSGAFDVTLVTGTVTQAIAETTEIRGISVYDSDNKFALADNNDQTLYFFTMSSGDITSEAYITDSAVDLSAFFDNIQGVHVGANGIDVLVAGENTFTAPIEDAQLIYQFRGVKNNLQYLDTSINNEIVEFDNETGTVTSATASTLVDTTKTWSNNIYNRFKVHITSGTGAGQVREILDTYSGTTISVTENWDVTPDNTSEYSIEEFGSIYTSYHTFNVDRMEVVRLDGELTLKADRDIEIQLLQSLYQSYNPDFGFTDVTETNRHWWIKTVKLNANEDTSIRVQGAILTQTTNTGMVGEIEESVSSATSITLTDSSKSWVVNEYEDVSVEITDGLGSGQTRTIVSNTSNTLTVNTAWDTTPDNTSKYEIKLGSARPQDVKVRFRVCTNEPTKQGKVSIRDFRFDIINLPTNNGYGLQVYSSNGRERTGVSDVTANGESPVILYPDPNTFNIDNYTDGDGNEVGTTE